MCHAWRVESKREGRSRHERNKKREREKERNGRGSTRKVLLLGRSLILKGLWSKAKGASPPSTKNLSIFSSQINFSHFLSEVEVLLVK